MAFSIQYFVAYTNDCGKLRRKAELSVHAGHILKFLYDPDLFHVEAVVQSSQRDRSYKMTIDLDESYGITHTSCECPLRLYKCHHVAAALLYGFKNVSKTDVKCRWLRQPKSAPPKETKSLDQLYPDPKPHYRALKTPVTDQHRQFLYKRLGNLGGFTAMHWILSPEPVEPKSSFPVIADIISSPNYISCTVDKKAWLRDALRISPEVRQQIVADTIGQRENQAWCIARKMRFTASNFGSLLRAVRLNRISESLKKQLLSPYNLDTVACIQWGVTHEKSAIQQYEMCGGQVQQTGLWMHESGVLAASPDGEVLLPPTAGVRVYSSVHCPLPELIEVKCPYSIRDPNILESITTMKDPFLGVDNGEVYMRKSHNYYHQVQGQLHVAEKSCCDFVVWTTKDMIVVRVERDMEWRNNLQLLVDFDFDKFVPLL